jgi:hypothetical protein
MNSTTAEALLRCYRGGQRADPRTQKAVRFAESDETLRRKLSAQMEFDERIVEVIHFIKPPENLRKKLAERNASAHSADGRFRSNMRQPAILAAVAGVLLIVGVVVFLALETMESFPGREAAGRMLSATRKMSSTDFERVSGPVGTLGDWFFTRGFNSFDVPPELADFKAIGCRVLSQDGHSVAQVAVEAQESILYVFRASDFGVQIRDEESWRVFEHEDWVAAVRHRQDHCYMIAFHGRKEAMRRFLKL